MRAVLGGCLVVLGVVALVSAQAKTAPPIDKFDAEFMAAFNAKDAAKVASFYTEDAVFMPPNKPIARGRSAIEAHFKQAFTTQGVSSLKMTPIESRISANDAFEAGTAIVTISRGTSLTLTGVGGNGSQTQNEKFVTILRKVGGQWKIAYDIFNSDQPPPK